VSGSINVASAPTGPSCCDNRKQYESLRTPPEYRMGKGRTPPGWASEEISSRPRPVPRALGFATGSVRFARATGDLSFWTSPHINWFPCNDPTNHSGPHEDGARVHFVMVSEAGWCGDAGPSASISQPWREGGSPPREGASSPRPTPKNKALFDAPAGLVNAFAPASARKPYHHRPSTGGSNGQTIGRERPILGCRRCRGSDPTARPLKNSAPLHSDTGLPAPQAARGQHGGVDARQRPSAREDKR